MLPQFLDELKLNKYEKEIINYLASVNSANAKQIYKKTKVPQGRIYSVLSKLKNNGFVTILPTSPKKYQIKNIKESLKIFLNNQERELKEKKERIKDLELKPKKYVEGKKDPSISIILGKKDHIAKVVELRETAKKEILQTAPTFSSSYSSDLSLERSLSRGLKMRIIIRKIMDVNRKKIKIAIKNGAKVRIIKGMNLSLFIKDQEEVLVGSHIVLKEERAMLWSKSKPLINALKITFNEFWKKAKPVTLKDLKN